MKSKNKTKKKYDRLLTTLLANFVLAPFLRGNIGELVLSGIFLYSIILIVKTFSLRPILFKFFSSIAILAFILEIIIRLELSKFVGVYSFLIQGVFALYLAAAVYFIDKCLSGYPYLGLPGGGGNENQSNTGNAEVASSFTNQSC